jgi:hypothetical protein
MPGDTGSLMGERIPPEGALPGAKHSAAAPAGERLFLLRLRQDFVHEFP